MVELSEAVQTVKVEIYVKSSKREQINLDGFGVFRMKDVGEVRIALVTPHQPSHSETTKKLWEGTR